MSVSKCAACEDQVHDGRVGCKTCMTIYIKPCQGCMDRVASPNCHDTCKRFAIKTTIKTTIEAALKARARMATDADEVSHALRDRCIKRDHRKVKIRPKFDR